MAELVNVYRYISAGFARLDFHRIDAQGLPAGVTGTVTPGAVGVPAGRIRAVTTANIITPGSSPVPVPGDNALQGTFQFPNDQPRAFDIQFSEENFDNREAFQSIKRRDIGHHSFSGRDITPFTLNNIMLIAVSNASSKLPGVAGLGMYAGIFTNRAQMTARGRSGFVNRQAALMEGTVTLNLQDGYPWGESFFQAVEGFTQNYVEDWALAYPVTVHRWTASAGLTKYFLGEVPASVDLDDILIYTIASDGQITRKTADVTILQADKSITFLTAPFAAGITDMVAWYGYQPS